MVYAVLTPNTTTPFQIPKTPPQAPGNPLRLTDEAMLLGFENQPDRVFASKYARAAGKVLWYVTKTILHRDDLPSAEVFSSCHDFQVWLCHRDTE